MEGLYGRGEGLERKDVKGLFFVYTLHKEQNQLLYLHSYSTPPTHTVFQLPSATKPASLL